MDNVNALRSIAEMPINLSDIIQRLRDAYTENPAAALKLIPELIQAADDGWIVELPCKPGDVLYVDSGCLFFSTDNSFTPCEVVNVRLGRKGGWRIYLRPRINREIGHYHVIFPASSIGLTAFFDPESAEKALKERGS